MDKADLHLGMQVVVRSHQKAYHGVVTKIGRTLVTIKYDWAEDQFRIKEQVQTGPQYGYGTRFITAEQASREERRKAAIEELKVLGWVLDWQCKDRVPLVQLEKVVAILKEDATNVVQPEQDPEEDR